MRKKNLKVIKNKVLPVTNCVSGRGREGSERRVHERSGQMVWRNTKCQSQGPKQPTVRPTYSDAKSLSHNRLPKCEAMSSSADLPDETLRRVLDQIQLTLTQSHRQLSLVKAQRAGKEREHKGVELTRLSVEAEAADGAKTYRAVGKM